MATAPITPQPGELPYAGGAAKEMEKRKKKKKKKKKGLEDSGKLYGQNLERLGLSTILILQPENWRG